MPFQFQINRKYLLLALLLFLVEVFIALYVRDAIIRPYGGDFLVVILLYCFVKGFWKAPNTQVALAVLLFSYLIETLQYFRLVELLGLQHSRFATVVIGTSFQWHDIVAYTLGILTVLLVEKIV